MGLTSVLLLIGCFAASVQGHGYLVEPPGRASAWRFGFDTPVDYNDNECFCGGFNYQYQVNGGKCGICGDAWDADPREHEVGGLYATGTLVMTYVKGQIIPVTANVIVNHLGHFEYKICANNNATVEATQECLDITPLNATGHEDWFLYIGSITGVISHELQLPADLECEQCVLQWRYVASNTWGICENGTEGTGCGPQEEFRGCADVSILTPPEEREGLIDLAAEPAEEISNIASEEEESKKEIVSTTNEVEMTRGENVYSASEEESKEQNVNTTSVEEETKRENVTTASKEKKKEEKVNNTGEKEETQEEETEQLFQEPANKLKEMPSSMEMKIDEQEEVSTDKKRSKRGKKSEEISDNDESDEDEALTEIEK